MAQRDISELRADLAAASSDRDRLRALVALAERVLDVDHREAHRVALESFDLATRLNDLHCIANSLRLMGVVNTRLGSYPLALEQLDQARSRFEQLGDTLYVVLATNAIATVHAEMMEYIRALEGYRQAEALLHDLDAPEQAAGVQINLGLLYSDLGDFTRALEHYEKGLTIAQQAGYLRGISSAEGNMGIVYKYLGEHQKALSHYRRARELAEAIGYSGGVARWIECIGGVHSDLGEYREALRQYRDANSLAVEQGDPRIISSSTGNIGLALKNLGDYPGAREHFQRALEVAGEAGILRWSAHWTAEIGRLHFVEGYEGFDADLCIHYLLKAAEIAIAGGIKPHLVFVYEWLSAVYRHQGKLEHALEYLEKHYRLKEELQNLEAHRKAQQLEYRQQLAELEKQRAIEQAEATAAMEIQRMKAEQTEKELGNATLQLLAQTELLADLRADLLKIARKIPPTEPGARELRERVKNLPCQSVDWDRFDRQFRAVHPEFIRRLTERSPDLTAAEVRICTMLRMNLKSHEMAQIFCITEAGVEFHRRNIRRKLKLAKEEKLPIVLGAM